MVNVAINGSASPTNPNAFTGWNPVFCIMPVPLLLPASNGERYGIVTAVRLWGGTGGTIGLYVADDGGGGYVSTAGFGSVASGSWDTGWRGLSKAFDGIQPGWAMRVGFTHSGTLHYGRHAAGGDIFSGGGVEWSGASLSGEVAFAEVPPAPTMLGAFRMANGQVRVQFQSNGDGGSAITGWVLRYADNPSFDDYTDIWSSGTSDLDLPPGEWWFAAAGRNYVSDRVGVYGPWSTYASVTVTGGGRRMKSPTTYDPFGTYKRRGASSWIDLSTKKRFNGSTWVDLSQ